MKSKRKRARLSGLGPKYVVEKERAPYGGGSLWHCVYRRSANGSMGEPSCFETRKQAADHIKSERRDDRKYR